jgi:hypothetical protein
MRRDCWDTEKKLREDINTSLVRVLNVGDDGGVLVPVQPPSFRSRDDLGVRKLHVANPQTKHVLTYSEFRMHESTFTRITVTSDARSRLAIFLLVRRMFPTPPTFEYWT